MMLIKTLTIISLLMLAGAALAFNPPDDSCDPDIASNRQVCVGSPWQGSCSAEYGSHRIPPSGYWCEGDNDKGYGYWTKSHWEFARTYSQGCADMFGDGDLATCVHTGPSCDPLLQDSWTHAGACAANQTRVCDGSAFVTCQSATCVAPDQPLLNNPANAQNLTKPFVFTWSAPSDTGSGLIGYWLDVDDNNNWGDGYWNYSTTGTSLSSDDFEAKWTGEFAFLPGKTYQWRVYAQVCASPNTGTPSATRSFTIAQSAGCASVPPAACDSSPCWVEKCGSDCCRYCTSYSCQPQSSCAGQACPAQVGQQVDLINQSYENIKKAKKTVNDLYYGTPYLSSYWPDNCEASYGIFGKSRKDLIMCLLKEARKGLGQCVTPANFYKGSEFKEIEILYSCQEAKFQNILNEKQQSCYPNNFFCCFLQ